MTMLSSILPIKQSHHSGFQDPGPSYSSDMASSDRTFSDH